MANPKGNPNWRSGVSGNPNGRPPKGRCISDVLRQMLEQKDAKGVTRKKRIAAKLLDLAEKGNVELLKYLCDRLEGRPAQALELTGDEKRPLQITYVNGNKEA